MLLILFPFNMVKIMNTLIQVRNLGLILLVLISCGGGSSAPPASISFTASSSSIDVFKEFSLTWTSINATSCIATGDWSGPKPLMGTEVIRSSSIGSKSYVLTCSGTSSIVNVIINAPEINITILYDPKPKDARAKYLIDLGSNRPQKKMSNTYYTADDVSAATVTAIESSLQSIADYLGHYDIKYFAYGGTFSGSESVALEYCKLWKDKYDISEGRGCTRFTDSLKEGLGTGNANAASPGFSGTEDYWANMEVWKNPPNTISSYVENYNKDVSGYARVVMHEYVHIHQFRPQINAIRAIDFYALRAMPGWFTEGGAELFAILANNEINALNNLDKEYGRNLTKIRDNKYNLPTITERLEVFGRAQNYEYADYALGVFAVGYMVSLSSIQNVYMDLINDVYTKGWNQAFFDNIGLTVDSFYKEFETYMAQSDAVILSSIPKPENLKSEITPVYPIPRLQIEGAELIANSGGQPSTQKRTVYYFKDDSSLIPAYQGLDWPYIRAFSSATINQDSSITADISISGSGYVTRADLPLYQYSLDNLSSSAFGEGFGDKWYTVLPNGATSDLLGFVPRKLE
jgi:hypothetical protein